jgi:hypothetical protein
MTEPAVPLLGDVSLESVQRIEHMLDGGFARLRVLGLDGDVVQRASRGSHTIAIEGVLFGPEANEQLASLQRAAASGEELTFAADITTALELSKVVIASFRAVAVAGQRDRYQYEVIAIESPPLPPPAQVQGLGALGDLGIDAGIVDDIRSAADEVQDIADRARDVVDGLSALSSLADLGSSLGGLLSPLDRPMRNIDSASSRLTEGGSSVAGDLRADT